MAYEHRWRRAWTILPAATGLSRLFSGGRGGGWTASYIALIGGTETYGKFIEEPYPALVEAATGRTDASISAASTPASMSS